MGRADLSVGVQLQGWDELRKAFKNAGDKDPRALSKAMKSVAEPIAAGIRGKVPRRTGAAAGSVKASGGASGALVVAGSNSVPYFPWLDFGGSVGRGHQRGKWQGAIQRDWRGKPQGDGRYIYPAIMSHQPQTRQAVISAINQVLEAEEL